MTAPQPKSAAEWARRALLNIVGVLDAQADSLTVVGGQAVAIRTAGLDALDLETSDGDLAVTPALVATAPSLEALLLDAGYERRTEARPGLWGRERYEDRYGTTQYREKIDLSVARALSGSADPRKRSVPALVAHGRMTTNNASGLELATVDRSPVRISDLVDPDHSATVHAAGHAALMIGKSFKITDRLTARATGPVRDKDYGDLWRLAATADEDAVRTAVRLGLAQPTITTAVSEGVRRAVRSLSLEGAARATAAFGDTIDNERIRDDFTR